VLNIFAHRKYYLRKQVSRKIGKAAEAQVTKSLCDKVKIHLICEYGDCHFVEGAKPYVVTVPTEKVKRWGPLVSTCLKYVGSAVKATSVPGTGVVGLACGSAAEYIDDISEPVPDLVLQGMDEESIKKKQKLIG
jgi:hypothetical protein